MVFQKRVVTEKVVPKKEEIVEVKDKKEEEIVKDYVDDVVVNPTIG